jgi:predicted nucleic acid-binding protein
LYLVDTNVISAGAPSKHGPRQELVEWMDASSDLLFLSVMTAAEVESGIAKALRAGAKQKAEALQAWWALIEHIYGERILPVDLEVAHATGRILDKARAAGHTPGLADVVIAGTAQVRDLAILTRNVKHFTPFDVRFVDPFEALPRPSSRAGS